MPEPVSPLPEVRLSHRQTNELLRAALRQQFPHVQFYVRIEAYGDTRVYYVHGRGAPVREAVERVASGFADCQLSRCDSWDVVAQTRPRADGQLERVWYGSRAVRVCPVALGRPRLFRRDGLVNLCDIGSAALRRALRRCPAPTAGPPRQAPRAAR